jgi:hypothetical protein
MCFAIIGGAQVIIGFTIQIIGVMKAMNERLKRTIVDKEFKAICINNCEFGEQEFEKGHVYMFIKFNDRYLYSSSEIALILDRESFDNNFNKALVKNADI